MTEKKIKIFSKTAKVNFVKPDNKINGDELRVGKTSRHLICHIPFCLLI